MPTSASVRPLRLVSHNVFWFQGAPFRTKAPRGCHREIFDRLTDLYRELQPDVLCLQEVHEENLAQELAAALNMRMGHCPGGREQQYGGALLWRGEGRYRDWRDTDQRPYRIWQQLELNADGAADPLRIINVHLPSNSMRTPEEGEQQRIASLRDVLAREPDVMMGDLNAHPDADALKPLHEAGYADVANHLGFGHLGTAGPNKRIDYAWVRRPLAERLRSFAVINLLDEARRPRDAEKHALSDHWPLWFELETTAEALDSREAEADREQHVSRG